MLYTIVVKIAAQERCIAIVIDGSAIVLRIIVEELAVFDDDRSGFFHESLRDGSSSGSGMVVAKRAIPDLCVAFQQDSSTLRSIPVLDNEAVNYHQIVVGYSTYHALGLAAIQYARMCLKIPLRQVVIVWLVAFEATIEPASEQRCEGEILFWVSFIKAFFDPDGAAVHRGLE